MVMVVSVMAGGVAATAVRERAAKRNIDSVFSWRGEV
jgi:hypothetical protein